MGMSKPLESGWKGFGKDLAKSTGIVWMKGQNFIHFKMSMIVWTWPEGKISNQPQTITLGP